MDKYIVVTGGAGFIGSAVLRALQQRGYTNLVVVDHFSTSEKWKNLVGKPFVDLLDRAHLFDWLKGKEKEISAFIHLGACSNTMERDSGYLLENNYRYSVRLARYALEQGHRFIYASSAATYGDGALGFSDAHTLLEGYRPLNMYGFSKHAFDLWLSREGLLDRVVGLKYFNVFGPNEYHKGAMSSAILKMVPAALKTGTLSLFCSSEPEKYQDGEQVRDFLYVKDAAEMTIQFLTNQQQGIFNIGSGKPSTWNRLAHAVINALKKQISISYVPMPEELKKHYQNYTCADMSKSQKLGLRLASFSLEEAVEEYVGQYILPERYW